MDRLSAISFFSLRTSGGESLACSLHQPSHSATASLVFVHGYFSGNRLGPNRLFLEIASLAASSGILALRYDWCGMGESSGDITATMLSSAADDLTHAIQDLQRLAPGLPLGIVSHSLGCAVFLDYLATDGHVPITAQVLLAPGPFNRAKLLELCPDLYDPSLHFERKGLVLSKTFLRQVADRNFSELLADLSAPTLTITCNDDLWSEPPREGFSNSMEQYTFPTGGHNFLAYQATHEIPALVIGFLRKNLR